MLIVQDQVWNRVTINRNSKKNTRYYIPKMQQMNEQQFKGLELEWHRPEEDAGK